MQGSLLEGLGEWGISRMELRSYEKVKFPPTVLSVFKIAVYKNNIFGEKINGTFILILQNCLGFDI